MKNTIQALVEAHFERNYTLLTLMGTTYELFGEGPHNFTAFLLDDLRGARTLLAHNATFEAACGEISREIEQDVLRYIESTEPSIRRLNGKK
jgi:hypothetical protein